jgi:hypothetical protein
MNQPQTTESINARDLSKSWSVFILGFLLILYWLLARSMERIEYAVPAWWEARAMVFPLFHTFSPVIAFLTEMLALRVLRHFIPVFVGWWLAYSLTIGLVRILYDFATSSEAREFLRRLQSKELSYEMPVYADRRNFAQARQQSPLLRLGGPGRVRVDGSDAAITEHNGRFHRVLGAGTHHLGRFEQVRAIVDLRPQDREQLNVSLITRDGIELKTDVAVTFCIMRGEEPATRSRPYPFDREAVRRAAYTETVLEDGTLSTWEQVALNTTVSRLQNIVAKYRLDDLIQPENSAANSYPTLHHELKEQVRVAVRQSGVEIMNIRLGRLEAPEPVTEQRIDYWRAYWEKERRITQAEGAAGAVKEIETARAEAEAEMIELLVDGLERVQEEDTSGQSRELVALRVIELLQKIAYRSHQTTGLPGDTLRQLQDLSQQLQRDTGRRSLQKPDAE